MVRPGFVRTAMTARNRFYMPMLMGPEDVAAQAMRAIRKKQTRAAFPWPMAAAVKFASVLPDALYDRLIRFLYSGIHR
jgi:short-subunit dehydrogenase